VHATPAIDDGRRRVVHRLIQVGVGFGRQTSIGLPCKLLGFWMAGLLSAARETAA